MESCISPFDFISYFFFLTCKPSFFPAFFVFARQQCRSPLQASFICVVLFDLYLFRCCDATGPRNNNSSGSASAHTSSSCYTYQIYLIIINAELQSSLNRLMFFLLHIASFELYCFGRYTSKPIDHVDCWSNWLTVMYSLIFFSHIAASFSMNHFILCHN